MGTLAHSVWVEDSHKKQLLCWGVCCMQTTERFGQQGAQAVDNMVVSDPDLCGEE